MTGSDGLGALTAAAVARERRRRESEDSLLGFVVRDATRIGFAEDLEASEAVSRAVEGYESGRHSVAVPVDVRGRAEELTREALAGVEDRVRESEEYESVGEARAALRGDSSLEDSSSREEGRP